MTKPIETDVVIIGAGPCGLFQVFQLGLQGISCCVIEALPHAGGQCAELYEDKPIYDIPGIPHILAGALTDRLLQQIRPFNPTIYYGQTVETAQIKEGGGYKIVTSQGQTLTAKRIILAAGAGAFTTVQMRVEGIEFFEQTQLFYRDFPDNQSAKEALSGKQVIVSGDTTAAISTAISASEFADKTTYIHRKRRLNANDATVAALTNTVDAGKLCVVNGKVTGYTANDKMITHLSVIDHNKETVNLPADMILARLGNSPKINNFLDWGLQSIRNHIEVNPANFQSNLPGFYAIGDINTYPGKRKLILCGFHEATLVAFDIAAQLNPNKPIHTQYTTTSTELHKRLGVTENRQVSGLDIIKEL